MNLNDWGRVLVSILVVCGFLTIVGLVLTTKLQGTATSEVLLVLLGALSAAFGQVISYWVGSSSGSAQKDTAIQNLAAKP